VETFPKLVPSSVSGHVGTLDVANSSSVKPPLFVGFVCFWMKRDPALLLGQEPGTLQVSVDVAWLVMPKASTKRLPSIMDQFDRMDKGP